MCDRRTLTNKQLIATHKKSIDEEDLQPIYSFADEAIEAYSFPSQMPELFLDQMFTAGVQNQ